jgi:hypothetical protein
MRVLRVLATLMVAAVILSAAVGCADDGGDDGNAGADDTTVDGTDPTVGPDDGDRPDDGPEALVVVSITTELEASFEEAGAGGALPTDEAECAASAIVDEIGVDRLAELGVAPDASDGIETLIRDTTNSTERTVIAEALSDCVDLVRTFSAVYVAIGLSESSATCAAEGIVADPELRTTLVLGDEPTAESAAEFDAVAEECFTAAEQDLFRSG